MRKRDESLHTVLDVVCKNTGMTKEQLLHDDHVYHIDGMKKAAEMIRKGVAEDKIFYICGDYDVDGIMASAALVLGLGKLHAKRMVRLPKRFSEGYGLQTDMVKDCLDGQILITVDNGICAHNAIALAKEKNMTVIVTDHHLPAIDESTGKPIYPNADLIIDPNAVPDSADFNGYCGAGLAFKLCQELLKDDPILLKIQSFAAIATIADSVPMTFENRRIVKEGLKGALEPHGATTGLLALLDALGITSELNETKVGFKIAPVLNAPGRLEDAGAMKSLYLMIFEGSYARAQEMANSLIAINEKRKEESEKWENLTKEYVYEHHMQEDYPLVVHMSGIPEGIIGIIAGKLSEHFNSPFLLLGDSNVPGILKGSCRSDGRTDLKDLLDHTAEYMVQYGGHIMAAGIKLEEAKLTAFREAAKRYLAEKRQTAAEQTCDDYDLEAFEGGIRDIAAEIERFAPYGEGNPVPTFLLKNVKLRMRDNEYYRFLSDGKGVKLCGLDYDAVSFRGGEEYRQLNCPKYVTLYGTISMNRFRGKETVQFIYSKIISEEKEKEKSDLLNKLTTSAKERTGLQ